MSFNIAMKVSAGIGVLLLFIGRLTSFAQSYSDSIANAFNDSVYNLNAVTVDAYHLSGNIRTIPGAISALKLKDGLLSDETSIGTLLNYLPGISAQTGTYTTNRIVIRGMGSRTPYNTNRIRTYINDIPVTGADGLSAPEDFDLQALSRIEVIKGPSSALYGSGLGGVLNLYTPSDKYKRTDVSLQYGSYQTLKAGLNSGIPLQKGIFRAALSHLQSDGYRENSEFRRTALISTLDKDIGDWKAGVLFMFGAVKSGIPSSLGRTQFLNDPSSAAQNWRSVNGYKQYTRVMGGISLQRTFSRVSNKLILFGRLTDNYERRPFNNLDDLSVGYGIRNKLFIHFSKADLIVGTELINEKYTWKLDTNDLINHNKETRYQMNAFSMLYYRPTEKLYISLAGAVNAIGYRLQDLYSENGDQSGKKQFPVIVSPRLGVNYSPNPLLAVFASAGHGFSLPSPEETLLPAGDVNHDIRHENGWQFELGTRLNLLRRSLSMDIAVYWIELKDLLVTKRITEDIFTGINAGKTRHMGIEMMLKALVLNSDEFPGKVLTSLAFTSSSNMFVSFEDNGADHANNHLPGIPAQVVAFQLEWSPIGVLEIFADVSHHGRQFLDDGNAETYKGYTLGNIKVKAEIEGRIFERIGVYAGINNFTNTSYASMLITNAIGINGNEPRYYYPGLPRHGYFGVTLTF